MLAAGCNADGESTTAATATSTSKATETPTETRTETDTATPEPLPEPPGRPDRWIHPGHNAFQTNASAAPGPPDGVSQNWAVNETVARNRLIPQNQPVVADGRVVVPQRTTDPERLYAYDAASGDRLWTVDSHVGAGPVYHDGSLVVFDNETKISPAMVTLDPASGEEIATRTSNVFEFVDVVYDAATEQFVVLELLREDHTRVRGVDPSSGATRWSRELGGSHEPGVPLRVAVIDDTVFVTNLVRRSGSSRQDPSASALTAMDPESGATRWRQPVSGTLLGGAGDQLYTQRLDTLWEVTGLAARSMADGALRWETAADSKLPLTDRVAATTDQVLVVSGPSLTSLEPTSGEIQWTASLDDDGLGGPVLGASDAYVSTSGRFYSIDRSDGQQTGSVDLDTSYTMSADVGEHAIAVAGEGVYAVLDSGLYAFE